MSEAINFTAIIMSTLALVISLVSIVLVLAQKMSTHKIEWRPLTTVEPEQEEILTEEESDEEILEKALLLQKAGKKSKYTDPLADIESTNF